MLGKNNTDFLSRDWKKLEADPMIGAKEHWSDAYYQEVVDYGNSLEHKDEDVTQVSDVDAGKLDTFKLTKYSKVDNENILNQLFMLEDYSVEE